MSDFNTRFDKTWKRIPLTTQTLAVMVFMFYLKAINLNIVVIITSMGGDIFPNVYEVVV